ncbi:MAG: Tfp pilus assembly protein FimT/FimU [Candidatus Saccharibacteria bacterium]
MRQRLRTQRGFSLIELTIVVFIISLLIFIFIPKSENVKNQAKIAGVDANMNSVHAVIQGMIFNYSPRDGGRLETDLVRKINTLPPGANPDEATSKYQNPVTGGSGMAPWSQLTDDAQNSVSAALTYYPGGGNEDATWRANRVYPRLRGTIMISAFSADGTLVVKLYPFDERGMIMKDRIRTIW